VLISEYLVSAPTGHVSMPFLYAQSENSVCAVLFWIDSYTFRSAIWTYQFLCTFQIADVKVSIFVQECQITDLNMSLCMCKQIFEASQSLLLYVM